MRVSLGYVCIDDQGNVKQSGDSSHGYYRNTGRKLYKHRKVAENNCPQGMVVREAFAEL